jgi:hypothetical protein
MKTQEKNNFVTFFGWSKKEQEGRTRSATMQRCQTKVHFALSRNQGATKQQQYGQGKRFFCPFFCILIEFLIQLLFFHRKRGLPEQRRSLQR